MPSSSKLVPSIALAVLIAAIMAVYVSPANAAAKCTAATNIEAIIDDSASMGGTDNAVNRSEAIKLLISKAGNAKKTLGAVEFGSDQSYLTPPIPAAITLFAPQLIGPNVAGMNAALTNSLKADNGATDYNSAFALAKTDNPAANARIFITDGGHNEDAYLNGHQGGPPTYVLGLRIGAASATDADATRLQTIANETGGVYYPNVDTGNIAATVNKVDARLNCQTVAKTFTDTFAKVGQKKKKAVSIRKNVSSADLTLTWTNPLDRFTIGAITVKTSKGKTIPTKKLRIKRTSGKTFLNVNVRGLKRGKLRFQLRAKTLRSNTFGGATLTTQAVPRKR